VKGNDVLLLRRFSEVGVDAAEGFPLISVRGDVVAEEHAHCAVSRDAHGGCAAPRQHPEPAALVAKAELPPHVIEVAQGLFSYERGYLIKQGRCIPYEELAHGPIVEISNVPSAGDGAPETCPSGGCSSYASPSYPVVYSGLGQYGYDYWPAGFYYGGLGGVFCPPHVRRFRGGEFAFGGRARSFVQERRYEAWKSSFPGASFRIHSFAGRRSQAGGGFGRNRTGRWR
jgi:hypothetical protein